MNRLLVWPLLASLVLAVGLPLIGKWARSGGPPRCAFDGQFVEPVYRVRVVDRNGFGHEFCCIRCATRWLEREAHAPGIVFVTDEADRGEVESRGAHYVLSAVITNRVTGNRVHAFRNRPAAEAHAKAFGGVLLEGTERPLQVGRAAAGRGEVEHRGPR